MLTAEHRQAAAAIGLPIDGRQAIIVEEFIEEHLASGGTLEPDSLAPAAFRYGWESVQHPDLPGDDRCAICHLSRDLFAEAARCAALDPRRANWYAAEAYASLYTHAGR